MINQIVFRFILAALLLFFVAHRAYYTNKFPAQEEETVTKMSSSPLTILANVIALIALLSSVLFIIIPSWIAWAAAPLPVWLRWGGVLLALSGFGLLEWSHRALADNWSDQPRMMKEQTLVQTGPYQWVRHPIYTAFLLILGSIFLITANWLVGGAWIVSVALDAVSRIRFEEAVLAKRFGRQYEAYKAKTGRLIPKIGRLTG